MTTIIGLNIRADLVPDRTRSRWSFLYSLTLFLSGACVQPTATAPLHSRESSTETNPDGGDHDDQANSPANASAEPTHKSGGGGGGGGGGSDAGASEPVEIAGKYVANAEEFKDAADWRTATEVTILLGERGDTMYFNPKELTFEAGKPYILKLKNEGEQKHEFTAENFLRSVALRKAESSYAEVKAPFIYEVEINPGQEIELFFIPVFPGSYRLQCDIVGHKEAGMVGTIVVTGEVPTSPSPVLQNVTDAPWAQNVESILDPQNPVWSTTTTINFRMGWTPEGSAMFFDPKNLILSKDKAYKIVLMNVGAEVHELAAPTWFPTVAVRKIQDAAGEYKVPTIHEVEIKNGQQAEMYIIPLQAGTFNDACEISGHTELGMFGTVQVNP